MGLKNTVLVTGARGFVGRHLVDALKPRDCVVYTLDRQGSAVSQNAVLLRDVKCYPFDTVIHLAGRAHIFNHRSVETDNAFYSANVEFSMAVAKEAVEAGLKRFVFVSSVGVYGQESSETPINESFSLNPKEPYALSKLSAERKLSNYLSQHSVEFVVLRPALIYGNGAPGNLARLAGLCATGLPLPFKNAVSTRTMLDVESFCDAIWLCSSRAEAAGKIYNVADDSGVSTSQLVECLNNQLGKKNRQFAVPKKLMRTLLTFASKRKIYNQLFEGFILDNNKIKSELGWESVKNPLDRLRSLKVM